MTVFFKQLLDLCDKFGTNPSNVAKNIGISTAAPTRWRNEDAIPQSRTLQKIASHFNVTVEYLLGQEEVFTHTVGRDTPEPNARGDHVRLSRQKATVREPRIPRL